MSNSSVPAAAGYAQDAASGRRRPKGVYQPKDMQLSTPEHKVHGARQCLRVNKLLHAALIPITFYRNSNII
jgi:hypothetical protein